MFGRIGSVNDLEAMLAQQGHVGASNVRLPAQVFVARAIARLAQLLRNVSIDNPRVRIQR